MRILPWRFSGGAPLNGPVGPEKDDFTTMAKAINWPRTFRDDLLAEDTQTLRTAVRLGTLYAEHGGYWQAGEEVDIRCHHRRLRRAVIQGPVSVYAIGELPEAVRAGLPPALRLPDALVAYLSHTYGQPVSRHTRVSVVQYYHRPVVPEAVEADDDLSGRHV